MQVEDRKGILADVSSKIAGINTNIRNVEATSTPISAGRIDMTVEISDVKHLQKVIKSLRERRRGAWMWSGRARRSEVTEPDCDRDLRVSMRSSAV